MPQGGNVSGLLVVLAAALGGLVAAARADNAQDVFASLYGEKISKVAATGVLTDDTELAAELLAAARNARDRKDLLALLCEKASELGGKTLAGYPTAIEALGLLAETHPDRREDCRRRIFDLRQRQYYTTSSFRRVAAGEAMLDSLAELIDPLVARREFAAAAGLLRTAVRIAGEIRSQNKTAFQHQLEFVLDRERIARQIDLLARRLEANPLDRTARGTLIRLWVVEFDDPAAAARHVDLSVDEATRTYLPLAGKPIDAVPGAACLELADWYRSLTGHLTPYGRRTVLSRSAAYYQRYLATHPEADLSRKKAELALQGIRPEIDQLPAPPPGVRGKSQARLAMVAFDKARSRLPVDQQVKATLDRLVELSGGRKVAFGAPPVIESGRIVEIDLRDNAELLSIDALYGLPLRSLNLEGCKQLAGDLAALKGMPLTSLSLSGCEALTSLEGLKGAPLKRFDFRGCKRLKSIAALKGMAFRIFEVCGCEALTSLEGLEGMPLTALVLRDLKALAGDLSALRGAPLASLTLSHCPALESLRGIEDMQIGRFRMTGCTGLRDTAGFKGTGLTVVDLGGCAKLGSIEGLSGLRLTALDLAGCKALTGDLSVLEGMPLAVLNVSGTGLTSLKGMEALPLTRFTALGCPGLPAEEFKRLLSLRTLQRVATGDAKRDRFILRAVRALPPAASQPARPGR